ncbi:MAG: hypothetical protein KKA62_00165 [Nanoarchaeota archaeon]|nr:hypothetical protein [Nanoarchaeota archaeon]
MEIGVVRIKTKDLQAYEKTAKSWKKSKLKFPEILKIIKLFKANNQFKILIDKKNPEFLKGQLSPDGNPQGARIDQLPNGEKIDKAFSLFADHLTIHDQDSEDHWDVIYQNKGGTYAYCYTLEKKKQHKDRKYHKVEEFNKCYNLLLRRVSSALKNKDDSLALPLYTLLKTYMRVGNEIYFKTHKHQGLTTLKKSDVKIKKDVVVFNYIAKDGVPRLIEKKFSKTYLDRLKRQISPLKPQEFIFTSSNGHPLREPEFKKAFKQYCGKEFYPHIVRSHYATSKVKEFLKNRKKTSKEEVNALYLSIAAELGHKRFIKKENQWKDNYTVTINHYVQPELIEKVKRIIC